MTSDEVLDGTRHGELEFPTLLDFVRDFLSPAYERQVSDQHDTAWCCEWWRHHEGYLRLDALWRAYEHLRRDEGTGLSEWWFEHADPHMTRLMDPQGPFRYCSAREHREVLAPLPTSSLPWRLREPRDVARHEAFETLEDFVDGFVRVAYARQVYDTQEITWCPEWWRHPEAVSRLTAMWRAFEHLRAADATGMSNWWLSHADKHMARLFDPRGTFKYCSARDGHRDVLVPLPSGDRIDQAMFAEVDATRLDARIARMRGES
jgi:hypothetical protein